MFHDRFPTWARARGLSRGLAALLVLAMAPVLATDTRPLAFPGAQGAAAHTPGGRGGKIVRVTTLAADGPGSFKEAVSTKGPRIVVFEVGGVIDLGMKELRIDEPFLTIAGQIAHQEVTALARRVDFKTAIAVPPRLVHQSAQGGAGATRLRR